MSKVPKKDGKFHYGENKDFSLDKGNKRPYSIHRGTKGSGAGTHYLSDEVIRSNMLRDDGIIDKSLNTVADINRSDAHLIGQGYSRVPVAEAMQQTTDPSILKQLQNMPDVPTGKFSYLKKIQGLTKILPMVGTVATGLGALGYSDMAGAATDAVIPGGMEETNTSPEQKMLDQRYLQRIKSMQQRKK